MTLGSNHNNPPIDIGGKENKNVSDRAIKGYAIISKGDIPQIVNEEMFLVPSQNSNRKYKVILRKSWSCDCPDFKFRKVKCKHIYAVEFLLKMREKVNSDSTIPIENEFLNDIKCAYCGSTNLKKNGSRKTESGLKQRYLCKDCKKTFIPDKEFEKIKANPKIVTLSMDLYYKGLSLRDISDTIYQFYDLKISHETIRNWIMKFTIAINDYVNSLKPKVSDVWHVDEQMVKIKGKWLWSWNILDEQTRFLLANAITKNREIHDARQVFQKAKGIVDTKPEFLVTDGLFSYEKAIKKEFKTDEKRFGSVKHVRLKSIRDARTHNNLIERFHNTFRERDKVMRGFKSDYTARQLIEGFKNYYNFIRPHTSLNGLTPSQVANLDLQLDRNKWLSLLRKSFNLEKQN